MFGPANGVRNYLALANIFCKLIFRIRAGFRRLNYGDIKQFSHERGMEVGGGGASTGTPGPTPS